MGTSGLVLREPNKEAFPAEFRAGSRLTYYAAQHNSIEINSSFYKVPMAATFKKWADQVPEDFRFTLKLWKGVTHQRNLAFQVEDIQAFMQAADQVGEKKGCLLIQFPPGLSAIHMDRLKVLLKEICRFGWKTAVEFRHTTWYISETYRLLDTYHASMVLQDMPAAKMMSFHGKATFVYLRFHGPAGDYKGSYSPVVLQEHAEKIAAWLSEKKDVYVYFNNTIGDAVANLDFLRQQVLQNDIPL